MILAILIVILLLAFYLGLKKPTYLVLLYIAASTKFFGFFDMGLFIVNGTDLGFFSLNIVVMITVFLTKPGFKIPRYLSLMVIVIILLWGFGVLYPYFQGYESFMQAIIASKQFFFFSFFLYLFKNYKKIDFDAVVTLIKFIGIYLSLVLIINLIVSIAPPTYIVYDKIFSQVRIYFPTYISLAAFLYYADWLNGKTNVLRTLFIISFLIIGLSLAGHFSIVVTTVFGLMAAFFIWNKNGKRIFGSFLKKLTYLILILILIFSFSTSLRENESKNISIIADGSDVALTSRVIYNKFRWEAIYAQPLFGYGFIHKTAPIMRKFDFDENNRYMEKLGVIDSGYVDLFLRFGYIGTFIYLFTFGLYLITILRAKVQKSYLSFVMAIYLFQYYILNYTWSVFSFSFGIIPMSLAFSLILYERKRNKDLQLKNTAKVGV